MKPDRFGVIITGGAVALTITSYVIAEVQVRGPNDGSYLVGISLLTAVLAVLFAIVGSITLAIKARGLVRIGGVLIGVIVATSCYLMLGAAAHITFQMIPR